MRRRGATVVGDLEAALDLARQEAIPDDGMDRSEIWIIGGAQLFNEALPQADKAYVTQIRADVEADTYAPDMDALLESGLWARGRHLAVADAGQVPRAASAASATSLTARPR